MIAKRAVSVKCATGILEIVLREVKSFVEVDCIVY